MGPNTELAPFFGKNPKVPKKDRPGFVSKKVTLISANPKVFFPGPRAQKIKVKPSDKPKGPNGFPKKIWPGKGTSPGN